MAERRGPMRHVGAPDRLARQRLEPCNRCLFVYLRLRPSSLSDWAIVRPPVPSG